MKSDIHLSPGTKRGPVDVLSSASAPAISPDAFVIGTSKGILRVNQNMDMSWIRTLNTKDHYYSDVFALQYHLNHKDIILTGERRGILSLLDLRTSQSGPIAKIQHTSGIAEIKSLDEHRVLVAGCASDLCQYDRRFIKPNTHLSHTLKHTKNTTAPTTPYLTYPDYRNNGRLNIGLDVDLELGIIAAADDVSPTDAEARIKIFSLHGAQVLHEHTVRTDVPNMGCVKFVQDTFNEPKSIWATFAQRIVRLSLDDNHNIPSFKASTTWLSGVWRVSKLAQNWYVEKGVMEYLENNTEFYYCTSYRIFLRITSLDTRSFRSCGEHRSFQKKERKKRRENKIRSSATSSIQLLDTLLAYQMRYVLRGCRSYY